MTHTAAPRRRPDVTHTAAPHQDVATAQRAATATVEDVSRHRPASPATAPTASDIPDADVTGTSTSDADSAPPTRVARLVEPLARPLRRWAGPVVIANLVGQVLIILTGGLVRLTASGLGCTTWPLCTPGSFTPELHDEVSFHPFVEFGNRAFSFLLGIVGLLVLLAVVTDRRRSVAYRRLGWIPLLGVMVQGVIGGILVLVELPPALVGFHLLISMALVVASAYLVQRQAEGDGPPATLVTRGTARIGALFGALLVPVLVLGVITTGAGPHSGDDKVGYRFDIDPTVIAKVHAWSVWLFIAVLALLTWRLLREPGIAPRVAGPLSLLWLTVFAQGVAGYVQYFTDLPWGIVAIHMLLAATLAALVTLLLTRLRTRGA